MKPNEMILMVSLGLSPSAAVAELARLEPALVNLAHPFPVGGGLVKATTLNVRELPDVQAPVLGKLAQDAALEIWGQTADGAWLAIRAGELAGWVSRDWVERATQ